MPNPTARLNYGNHGFFENQFGTKLAAVITLLNEAKTDYNAHTHSGAGQVPVAGALIAAADVAAFTDLHDFTRSNPILYELAPFFGGLVALVNDIKAVHNAHTHTAADEATAETFTAAALPTLDALHIEKLGRMSPAMGHQAAVGTIGQLIGAIGTLANELRTEILAHVHPTALSNTPDLTIGAATLGSIS